MMEKTLHDDVVVKVVMEEKVEEKDVDEEVVRKSKLKEVN